jgi:hypothetical protein
MGENGVALPSGGEEKGILGLERLWTTRTTFEWLKHK